MEIRIEKKYLIFPINTSIGKKRLTFLKDHISVYALNIRLDNLAPDFEAFIDVSRFLGETLELTVEPDMTISFRTSDEIDLPDLYQEQTRPQVHFSPKIGWNNDPNGLVYVDGIYHMFFQYNPTEPKWDNMHWGHAISSDLIHWEEVDIALFPSDDGMKFSGSAIVDEQNLLRLQTGDTPTVVLYHTVTEPNRQCIAYSTDNLKTIVDAADVPVLPHIIAHNRDPKVVWCEEMNRYIMALYMDKDIYSLFSSTDLKNWKQFQDLHLPGDDECPDLFVLTDKSGKRKWVLAGASGKYIVGTMQGDRFRQTQSVKSLHFGTSAYAGQSFSNLPNNRVVRIDWDTAKGQWPLLRSRVNGQMGIPLEMTLETIDGTDWLCANPVKELETIYQKQRTYQNQALQKETPLRIGLNEKACLFRVQAGRTPDARLDFTVFGCHFQCDFSENAVVFGDNVMPIAVAGEKLDLTVLVDTCSFELFADGGKAYMTMIDTCSVCDRNLPYLEVRSTADCVIDLLEVTELNSIWKQK